LVWLWGGVIAIGLMLIGLVSLLRTNSASNIYTSEDFKSFNAPEPAPEPAPTPAPEPASTPASTPPRANEMSSGAELQLRAVRDHPDHALAESGDMDAQFRLGIAFLTGRGVLFDERKATEWFNKAAENGHKGAQLQLRSITEDMDAQFRLGIAYLTGRGVLLDKRKAIEWLNKAAENGHKGAQLQLRSITEEESKDLR
jgi:TPR repeat protein